MCGIVMQERGYPGGGRHSADARVRLVQPGCLNPDPV